MNILQINNFHFPKGGSDRYFLEVTRLLRDMGHDARTFSTDRKENTESEWLAINPISGINTDRADGVSNLMRFMYSPEARRRMRELLSKFRPEIAHLHIFYGQLTASIVKPLRDAGMPVVQTLHEYKLVCPTSGLFANGHFCDACQGGHYWHAVLQCCNRGSRARSIISMTEAYISDLLGVNEVVDRFIAVSEFQKKELVRQGIPSEKISVLYHFTEISPAPQTSIGKYFLFVGRILEDKGIAILLSAYARLNPTSPPLKVVGTGDEIERWKAYANDLGLAGRVEWLGYKTGAELNQLYRECYALINPSLLNETFGLTCLEAQAQGRAVIATRVGAFPEVVSDGVDGLLCEPGNPESLAEAMALLAHDSQLSLSMGYCGWEKANRMFSKQRHYQGLMYIYSEVVRRKGQYSENIE